jgi:UPF0755 protein
MRIIVLAISAFALLVFGTGAFVWSQLTSALEEPSSAMPEEKIIMIPAEADAEALVELFAAEALIEHPGLLRFWAKHFARKLEVKPGEYALSTNMAPIDLLKRVESGKVVTYPLTIPPGVTISEVADLVAEKKLAEENELKAAARDKKLADRLGVPNDTLEGWLFPDIYELPRHMTPAKLLEQLVQRHRKYVSTGILDSARKNELTEHDLITLASLIEESGTLESEQRIYSAMLHNRLRAKQPLEAEAALLYGLALEGLNLESATKQEIKTSPWNLSVAAGLPPGPISSPSLAAIVAASEPASSPALYRVRRPDGTHVYCPDEDCHQAAIKEWQKQK